MGQDQQPFDYAGRSKRAAVDTGQLLPASALHPSHELPHHDPDHEGRADRYQGLVSDQIGKLICRVLYLPRRLAVGALSLIQRARRR
jgi:hypothetical protein